MTNTLGASLVAQRVKNLPAMQETWVGSLDQEDPLEKGTATCSSILAWRIPWTEEPSGPTVHGVAKSRTQLSACEHTHTHNGLMGEGCQNSEFYPTGVEVISFSPSTSPDPKEARNPEVHKDEHRNSSQRNLLFLICGREKWT